MQTITHDEIAQVNGAFAIARAPIGFIPNPLPMPTLPIHGGPVIVGGPTSVPIEL